MRFLKNRDINKSNIERISIDCVLACIYFMCLPFTVVTTSYGSLLKLVTLPIIGVLVVRALMGKNEISFNYVHFIYIVYIIYTVGLLIVYNGGKSVVTTKDMVLGMLMFILISMRVYNGRERELMETAWLVVGLVCIYACLTSTEVVSRSENRAVIRILGFEEDQNQFCAYLIVSTLVCVKRLIERRKFYPIYAIVLGLSFYAILKTGSRGGLLGILLGVAAYAAIGIKSFKAKVGLAAAAVFLGIIIITVVMPMLPQDVAERYTISSVQKSGGSGRTEIWNFLIDYSVQEPSRLIRGSGIFSTYDIMYAAGFQNGVAHNAFIQILNDEGLIGVILFAASVAACIFRNIKQQPLYACAMIALIGFAMSLSFYVFKPYLNIMMMCAMSFEGCLPEDRIKCDTKTAKGEKAYA